MTSTATRASRPRLALQQSIVKLYKVAGIVALGGILIGLVFWVVVSIFYFFDDSWVRPVILGPRHEKVMAVAAEVAAVEQRVDTLELELARADADLDHYGRVIANGEKLDEHLEPALRTAGYTAATAAAWLAYDEQLVARADAASGQKIATLRRQQLDRDLVTQRAALDKLRSNLYYRARSERVVVGFVPYANLDHARPGATLYRCKWGLVRCSAVGKVMSVLDGEVTDRHPHNDALARGVMVELSLTDPSAGQDSVLFAGSKPFWLF
jgi:hypothetical protein